MLFFPSLCLHCIAFLFLFGIVNARQQHLTAVSEQGPRCFREFKCFDATELHIRDHLVDFVNMIWFDD